jgi:hypothetical protein
MVGSDTEWVASLDPEDYRPVPPIPDPFRQRLYIRGQGFDSMDLVQCSLHENPILAVVAASCMTLV